jgi:hypothetical protein
MTIRAESVGLFLEKINPINDTLFDFGWQVAERCLGTLDIRLVVVGE